jgi:hypothetical protein
MSIFFSTFAPHFKASDLFIAYLNTTTLVVYDLEIRHKYLFASKEHKDNKDINV